MWARGSTIAFLATFLAMNATTSHSVAKDLVYATSAPVTAADPHYQNATQNASALRSTYEALVQITPSGKIEPELAESWRIVDDQTWEFKLRPVKFSDGSALTVPDVIYSIERPATIVNSPASFRVYTGQIASMEAVGTDVLRVKTKRPYPLLLLDLSNILIIKRLEQPVDVQAFNAGRHNIGTGPYRFVSYTSGEKLVLRRNDAYWGSTPLWDNVTIRFIPNDAARTTGLLSGSLDAIENVPIANLDTVRGNPNLVFESGKSTRVVFLFLDGGRNDPPGISAKDGSKLPKNPLADVRVRQAINLAIDRDAIRDRIMGGLAYPTNNIVFDNGEGFLPKLETIKADPPRAKALLAEAGYPDGFRLTLASPNDRLINDAKVIQAIAQMLTRVGIEAQVDVMPFTVVNTRGGKGEFAAVMMGWGTTLEASIPIRTLVACPNAEKGWGPVNWSNYCNPKLDAILGDAMSTVDTAGRIKLLDQAVQIVHDEVAIVPLYFQGVTWAARKGIAIAPRADERTMPAMFTPKD